MYVCLENVPSLDGGLQHSSAVKDITNRNASAQDINGQVWESDTSMNPPVHRPNKNIVDLGEWTVGDTKKTGGFQSAVNKSLLGTS